MLTMGWSIDCRITNPRFEPVIASAERTSEPNKVQCGLPSHKLMKCCSWMPFIRLWAN